MQTIKQILTILFQLLVAILNMLAELLTYLMANWGSKNKEYKADFAAGSGLLSFWNKGFCLSGRKNLTVKDSYQNALIIGGTGTGKSRVVLIPSLFTMKSSFVIHDPSGELFTKTAGYLTQRGYTVKCLHFANFAVSAGYNPLVRANTSSDIQKVASMLVDNGLGGKAKDPFWNTQAVALLTILISILKKQEPQFVNLYNVRQLLNQLGANPEGVDALFSEYADDILFSEYKSFIAYDEKVVNGVIATCKASLQIFSDDAVAKVTSFDNLDFSVFRKNPVALFIQNSVADQKYYSVLTSIFFEQFFSYIMSRFPKDKEQDIFLLIDEASSLHLPTLPLAVANVRKHKAGIMLLVQDFNQLVHHYGKYEAGAIRANCFAKMYFTGQSLETSKELEQTLGKYEFKDEKGNKVIRPLMTNDEIRTMQLRHALLICGHHAPIKTWLKPYYKSFIFSKRANIPAPEITSTYTLNTVPVLPLPITVPEKAQ